MCGARSAYVPDADFHLGDRIWYDPIPGAAGSGFALRVRAIFVRRTSQRVVIQAIRHDGTRERLVVPRRRIMRRDDPE